MTAAARAAAGLLCVAAVACTPPRALQPVLDLATAAPAADREASNTLVWFGTPAGIAHELVGFHVAPSAAGRDPAAWVARACEIGLRWPKAEARVLVLDLAPFAGTQAQSVELALNGQPFGSATLAAQRRRYRFDVPREIQEDGFNRLRLGFSQTAEPPPGLRKRLAAVLYGLAAGPVTDPGVGDLAERDVAPIRIEGGLIQAGSGSLRFALLAPEAAELRFAPTLEPAARAAGATATLRVTLRDAAGERTLWTRTLRPQDAARAETLPVHARAGTPIELSLSVEGPRFAWASWGEPRLLGSASADPLLTLPAALPRDARADALRRSLRDASVVYVILDAAGARHFGSYGYPRATTPEIDRIASEGVLFEDAYAVATFTLLAMGSAWTGALPDEHHNGVAFGAPLPKDRPTLAERLEGAGIHTAGFVSNGLAGPAYGLDRGFTEFEEVYKRFGSSAEAYRRVLPEWLRANAGRRFFAYLHFREPHFAYDPPQPFLTRFGPDAPLPRSARTQYDWITDVNMKRRTPTPAEVEHLTRLYDANLAYVDHAVGELRRSLEAAKLWDRTLVIVSADHGDALHEHGYIGHLDQVYEPMLRIPLVLKLPKGAGPAGLRIRGLADTTDVPATIADAMGVRDAWPRGRSLLPRLVGAEGRRAVLSRCSGEQPKYALREGDLKLVYHTARDSVELYDVVKDPGEEQELSRERPLLAAYYRQTIRRFILEMRRGPRAAEAEAALSKEQRENLHALGYAH